MLLHTSATSGPIIRCIRAFGSTVILMNSGVIKGILHLLHWYLELLRCRLAKGVHSCGAKSTITLNQDLKICTAIHVDILEVLRQCTDVSRHSQMGDSAIDGSCDQRTAVTYSRGGWVCNRLALHIKSHSRGFVPQDTGSLDGCAFWMQAATARTAHRALKAECCASREADVGGKGEVVKKSGAAKLNFARWMDMLQEAV